MDADRLKRILESPTRAKMTGWLDPRVLARSAVLVSIANLFGRNSDQRLIEALANQPQGAFDYSKHNGDFWLDYVADLGDGWNSTYAVARAIAENPGRVLIFGGDEVYPY